MLPVQFRLQLRRDHDFFQRARRKRTALYQVFWQPATVPQASVIVKKSIFAKATQRNQVKRRWREILRKTETQWRAKKVVVVPYSQSVKLSFLELETHFVAFLKTLS